MVTPVLSYSDAVRSSVVYFMTDRGSKSIPTLSPLAMRNKSITLFCALA